MWVRSNIALPKILKEMNPPITSIFNPGIHPTCGNSFVVWEMLDEIARSRGLKLVGR